MEEISTPVETVSADTSVTSAPETTDTAEIVAEPTEPTESTAETTTETANQDAKPTQAEKLYAGKYKSIEDLEKGYKEAEKSFNKVAELEKEIKAYRGNTPKYVNDDGKFNPEIKTQYEQNIDNKEFLTYVEYARGLDTETRNEVERLLGEAQRVYNPKNKQAYKAKLAEAKNYFSSELIESIANAKRNLEMQARVQMRSFEQQEQSKRANVCADKIRQEPELFSLVSNQSKDFSPEVLGMVETIFDVYGDVDVPQTMKAINAIKELGVKQYLAKQEFEKTKTQANVGQGNNISTTQISGMPTRAELVNNPDLYEKTINSLGGNDSKKRADVTAKLDAIIMKGN